MIKRIDRQAVLDLRHRLLRPNESREACIYPGDENKTTAHYGFFASAKLVGIVSVYDEPRNGAESAGWRIRGMAVDDSCRQQGIGSQLLSACEHYVADLKGRSLWCNARIKAKRFYLNNGFTVQSEIFAIAGIGDHFQMVKPLPE